MAIKKEIVVMGSGSVAVPGSKLWQVKPEEHYTCFDPVFSEHPPKITHPQVIFSAKSATATGLLPESIDEIHMHNLISDNPKIFAERDAVFTEASRILRPGGKVYSLNTQLTIRLSAHQLRELGEKHGFKVSVHLDNQNPSVRKLTEVERHAFLRILAGTVHEHEVDLNFHPKASLIELTKI